MGVENIKNHTIIIESIVNGLKKETEIIADSLEEALNYIKNLSGENLKVLIFDLDERIVFSDTINKVKKYKELNIEDDGPKSAPIGYFHYSNPDGFYENNDDDLYA
jgi:hypothetical protein